MKALIIGIVVYFVLGVCYAIDFFHNEYEDMVENGGMKPGKFFVLTIVDGITMAPGHSYPRGLGYLGREVIPCSTSLESWFETSGSHGACCSTTWRRRWIFRRQSYRLLSAEKSRFLTGSFLHSKRTMALATLVLTCCPSLLRIEVIDICPAKIERTRRGIRTRRPTPP